MRGVSRSRGACRRGIALAPPSTDRRGDAPDRRPRYRTPPRPVSGILAKPLLCRAKPATSAPPPVRSPRQPVGTPPANRLAEHREVVAADG